MADALKIGIAGLGTVGASLVRIIQSRKSGPLNLLHDDPSRGELSLNRRQT